MSHRDAESGSGGCEGRKSTIEDLSGQWLATTDSKRGFDDDQQVLKETDIQNCRGKGPKLKWPR